MIEENPTAGEQWSRPTGTAAIQFGGALLCLSGLAGFIWAYGDPLNYTAGADVENLKVNYWAGLIAGISLIVGTVSLAVGAVVRALYFLPGDDRKPGR